MDHKGIGWKKVGWIHLARDSDQWRAFMNAVMSVRGIS